MPIAPKRFKLQISNLTKVFPGSVRIWSIKFFERGLGQGHVTPEIFRTLNSYIAPKGLKLWTSSLTNVFLGTVQSWSLKFFEKGRGQGHVTTEIFWPLNSNSCKTIKATNFQFDTHTCFHDQSTHGLWQFFEKGRVQDHVTPKIFRL